jgi:hypothetical protein
MTRVLWNRLTSLECPCECEVKDGRKWIKRRKNSNL